MENVYFEDMSGPIRWQKYHKAIFTFLKQFSSLPKVEEDRNTQVHYASLDSPYIDKMKEIVNGVGTKPLLVFKLADEKMLSYTVPFMVPFLYFQKNNNNGFDSYKAQSPIMKELTYDCALLTTNEKEAYYILDRIEFASNSFKHYETKVNGSPTQLYVENVKDETQINISAGDKRKYLYSFTIRIPKAIMQIQETEKDTIGSVLNVNVDNKIKIDSVKTAVEADTISAEKIKKEGK